MLETFGDYQYKIYDDGTVSLRKYIGSDTYVTVPDKLNGKTVSVVGIDCFSSCKNVKSVIIPDGVKAIGINAFMDCTSLVSIVIPNSVSDIGIKAFYGCTSLTSLVLPGSAKSICYRK